MRVSVSRSGDIEVEVAGRRRPGRWHVSRGMIHVSCAAGSRSIPLGDSSLAPETRAIAILQELLREEMART